MTDRPVPVTELAIAATYAHELFLSYVAAGFTEAQALDLVKTAMVVAANQQGNSS